MKECLPRVKVKRLSGKQLALIKSWITGGATGPDDEAVPRDPLQHWAYQTPKRPEVPITSTAIDASNPIDAFIDRQHQANGITPVGLADRTTWVRRLYFDLIGLPPSRDQIDDFLRDRSPNAYARLVEELLESPQYGERWGRHWMDVWRYSDWSGYKDQLRGSQRHIWHWRDWIIQSLNADKGYDQMIVEMIAGDELAPDDLDVLRATGFLARNFHKSNRNIWLDATVEHTAKAFLGMTINCARCHDHKFDPISQSEYYSMRAIFEPHHVRTERIAGQRNVSKNGIPRAFDAQPDATTFLYEGGNEKHFDKEAPVTAAIPRLFKEPFKIDPVSLPPVAVFPSLWPQIEAEDIGYAKQELAKAQVALDRLNQRDGESETEIAKLRVDSAKANVDSLIARWSADKAKYLDDHPGESTPLAELAAKAEAAHNTISARLEVAELRAKLKIASDEKDESKKSAAIKDAKKKLKAAQDKLSKAESRQKDEKSDTKYTSVGKSYPRTSTGRRLALAKWIASRKNPLTARVAINHIWTRHFGEPLVANTFDFGLRSPEPVFAELLDWLAVELMENQWSMKHIHRLIVTSNFFKRQSYADSTLHADNIDRDPDNQLLWKTNPRRLDAEIIRDSQFHVAGALDLTQGGADIDYAKGETSSRRSIYFRHAYEKQMTMLVLFDAAAPNECYRRSESIIPQQALTLANSKLSLSMSRRIGK